MFVVVCIMPLYSASGVPNSSKIVKKNMSDFLSNSNSFLRIRFLGKTSKVTKIGLNTQKLPLFTKMGTFFCKYLISLTFFSSIWVNFYFLNYHYWRHLSILRKVKHESKKKPVKPVNTLIFCELCRLIKPRLA
jgi:hypothetical protein